jgi:hypothetical protein
VFALLIVGVVVAVPVLYTADRLIKARAQARRMRAMSERLTAATDRADKRQERRQEAAQASAALTSVIPAINRPPLTLPDEPAPAGPSHGEVRPREPGHDTAPHGQPRPRAGCGRDAKQDHPHARHPSHSGEHATRSAGRAGRG